MRSFCSAVFLTHVALCLPISAYAADGFDVVTLGARGGIDDGNLTAFMVSPTSDPRAILCDAGTLVNGLRVADTKGAFDTIPVPSDTPYTRVGYILRTTIKGYLISHAHMDHLAGLILASPDDSAKPIYALPDVVKRVQDGYFNWNIWANFGDAGVRPILGKYQFQSLDPAIIHPITGTAMRVAAFPLDHGGIESTAFLIEKDRDALLYFGDTGADPIEGGHRLADIWRSVAPRVKARDLRAIIIETSYPDGRPDKQLFGHLTPSLLLKSLADLETDAGGPGSLRGLPIVISHVKYTLLKGETPQAVILRELEAGNHYGVHFMIAEQGMRWTFRRTPAP